VVIYGCDVIGGTWPNVMGGSYQHPTDEGAEKVINRQGMTSTMFVDGQVN